MGKILPIILVMLGLGGGIGAGLALRPAADVATDEHVTMDECAPELDSHGDPITYAHGDPVESECEPDKEVAHEAPSAGGHGEEATGLKYVKLGKQFIVPVVDDGKVAALIVMSLSLEVDASIADTVYTMEPKLRDVLLRVMFLHANSGGFDGQFTAGEPMGDLRGSLTEAAQNVLGHASVSSVLVTDILRQDV